MPRKPPKLYDVRSKTTGAQVIVGVPLGVARSECSRLGAEARRPNPERRTPLHPQGEPWGMEGGVVTEYEVVGRFGIVVA